MTNAGTPPRGDEFEFTLLGPGYGESIALHIGGGAWALVDSYLDKDGMPAALRYLEGIGVDPAQAVVLVVATHWHDDHIRGMARTLEACGKAVFCCAAALRQVEFLSIVGALEERRFCVAGSGAREIHGVFTRLRKTPSRLRFVVANRRVFACGPCKIWALSPDDAAFQSFLQSIGRLVPDAGQAKTRMSNFPPNAAAVVLWVDVEDVAVLLGADMEKRGWAAILQSGERPAGKASAFKVPHHGSANADEPGVWQRMLDADPVAVLAPWRRGSRFLPSQSDMRRILSCTQNAYATANPTATAGARRGSRSPAVARTIRESGIRLRNLATTLSAVRLRRPLGLQAQWQIQPIGSAGHLQDFLD